MRDDALRLMHAVERQRRAAQRVADGTIDDAAARELFAASWDEALAMKALDQMHGASIRHRRPPT